MRIEIIHDTLANKVYDKASTDDKMRLKVANFIHTKYEFYKENNKLLDYDELSFIHPYIDLILLSPEEKLFVDKSEQKVRNQKIATWVFIGACFIGLLWLVVDNHLSWRTARSANLRLEVQRDSVMQARDSIQKLLDKEYELKRMVQEGQITINKTNEELQKLLIENQKLLLEVQQAYDDLEKANNNLAEANANLAIANAKLKDDKNQLASALADKKLEYAKAQRELSTQEKSFKLSKKAQLILYGGGDAPSEAEIKKAFQFARAAWEINNYNAQAMDVLSSIKQLKLKNNSGDFMNTHEPKYTYTHRKIKDIISKLDNKYGTLPRSELNASIR